MKGALSGASAEIGFADADGTKARAAADAMRGRVFSSNSQAVMEGDLIFLAVKPQILDTVLKEIAQAVKKRLSDGGPEITLVSMAPGWTIKKIQDAIGCAAPVARIMPNTPALVSKALIALCASAEVSGAALAALEKLLCGAGLVDRVEERLMDAASGVSGSGPAFAYLFIEALSDGGVRAGLPRDKALRYAAQTALGAATMVLETGRHPGELKDMVASPGGSTIAGIAALENGGFRAAAMNAVEAAFKRAVELG